MNAVNHTFCQVNGPSDSHSFRPSFCKNNKRKARFKNGLVFSLLLLAAAVVFTTVVLFLLPAKKATAKSTQYERRIVSVRVEQGDNLWNIASRYYCSDLESITQFISLIKKANHLSSDTIYPGTYLMIQYYEKVN